MMLQVNLLPGSRKGAVAARRIELPSVRLLGSAKDPWLVAAATAVAFAVATVGVLFTAQNARASAIATRLEAAVRDSAHYAKVISARRRLTAERDSIDRQLQVIRSIDEHRYRWAHILDEVSRALPAYTWLTLIEQTSRAPQPPATDTTASPGSSPAAGGSRAREVAAAARAAADSVAADPSLSFRLVGQTVDIQALTLFMRQLESSSFIQHVALTKSEIVAVDGKDVTQFELAAEFEIPPAGVVKTTPLVVPVR